MSSNIPTIRFVGGDASSPAFLYMNDMNEYTNQLLPVVGHEGPAAFDDADAGSGSFEPSMTSGITNVLQHHMNKASTILPDPRDILRSWNRRLQNTIEHQSVENLAFLKKDTIDRLPTMERHTTFLKSIDTPGFLQNESWLLSNVNQVVNQHELLNDLSGALGMSIEDLHRTMRESVPLYQSIIEEMFTAHTRLQKKLEQTDEFTKKLMSLSMEDTKRPESEALRQAILKYASAQYETLNMKKDYIDFCTLYNKYQALRSVLLLREITESAPPACTICMTDSINMTLIPCGHTFCSPCGSKQRSQCYICRVGIRDRQRLYFL